MVDSDLVTRFESDGEARTGPRSSPVRRWGVDSRVRIVPLLEAFDRRVFDGHGGNDGTRSGGERPEYIEPARDSRRSGELTEVSLLDNRRLTRPVYPHTIETSHLSRRFGIAIPR